jgi:amidase
MARRRRLRPGLLAAAAVTAVVGAARAEPVEERSLSEIGAALSAGSTSSVALTRAYLRRIERLDRTGPQLQSVISVNPEALAQARALDAERKAGRVRGPLHGVPILIKDNIETRELPTTAGALALADNRTQRDAPLVARLRAQGAVILGKTNLSEWANYRSTRSISGWSAVGGLTRNPHALDRNACGSSSGSGAAAAAALAAAAIGTETSGSIVCPASVNGVVGLKPTVGLVSRTHVIPIAASMDTAGPMTRSVRDAALVLNAIAGSDPADPATREADARKVDYEAGLSPEALRGARLGVLRLAQGGHPGTDALFEAAIATLKASGAEIVEVPAPDLAGIGPLVGPILDTEFKAGVNAYLAGAAPAVRTRSLDAVIAFNAAQAERSMPLFGQELLERAQATRGLDDPAYREALAAARRKAGPEGIDRLIAEHRLDALIAVSGAPAWPSDPAGASRSAAVAVATILPAVAGYPHLSVPMGAVRGLPVGLSFIGPAWSEARLLALGHAYEQAAQIRLRPRFPASLNETPEIARAFLPAR